MTCTLVLPLSKDAFYGDKPLYFMCAILAPNTKLSKLAMCRGDNISTLTLTTWSLTEEGDISLTLNDMFAIKMRPVAILAL